MKLGIDLIWAAQFQVSIPDRDLGYLKHILDLISQKSGVVSIPDRDLGYLKPVRLSENDAIENFLVSIPDRDLGYLKRWELI